MRHLFRVCRHGLHDSQINTRVSLILQQARFRTIRIQGNVAVTDMATPLTYERYCCTFEGSYMSDWRPLKGLFHAPIRYKHGLYFTGQRTLYSGGLPIAAQSGRTTAQTLCKDFGLVF